MIHSTRRCVGRGQRAASWVSCALLSMTLAVLTACGEAPAVGTSSAAAAVDPDGVLQLPIDLSQGGGLSLDPVDPTAPTPFWVHYMIYDTLLRQHEDGSYEPGLARSATIVDSRTIHIELREDVTFQDGEPFTAHAVKRSIERITESNNFGAHRIAELNAIDNIVVHDPTSLSIHLSRPTAGSFYNVLAHNETLVVSPKALDEGIDIATQPVGAGPFRVVRYETESRVVLEKFGGYFQADRIRLAGVELHHVAGPAATVNALLSNTVDAAFASFEIRHQVSRTHLATRAAASDGVLWYSMHCERGNPALADARVRRALNFAVDRQAINNVIFGGASEPMSQFFKSDSPYFNAAIANTYGYEPERARTLLREAGAEDLTLTVAVPAIGGPTVKLAEVVQQQWRDVGIHVELVPSRDLVSQFFIGAQMDLYANQQWRTWTDKFMRTFMPGSTGSTCLPTAPEFYQRVAELRALDPADPATIPLWQDIQAIISEGAYGVFLTMATVDNVWNPERLGNPTWRRNQVGHAYPDVWNVYIARPRSPSIGSSGGR